jgi:EmrB/QacA subfamily drug resistance transporter
MEQQSDTSRLASQTMSATRGFLFAPASPNGVLAIVLVGICLANLDLFIVNIALPNIAESFGGARLDDLSWVLNGYAIAYAALLVFFGRLAERHRRDISFLCGVGLFTLASAACGAASNLGTLVFFRVVQAAGAALLTPTSLGLLLSVFPPERRGTAVRTWAAIGGFASALGPLLGGLLVPISWRLIFWVNLPVGLLAILIGLLKLPRISGHDAPRPSFSAAVLVTAGIGILVLTIVKGNDWGWLSLRAGLTLLGAAACATLFYRHCKRHPNPFVNPLLFRIPQFTGATLTFAPYSIAFGALVFPLVMWEQTVWHWSALKAGVMIMPGPFMVPITSLFIGGRLLRWLDPATVVSIGLCFFIASFATFALGLGLVPNAWFALLGMILSGIGVGLTTPTLMGIGTSVLPPSSLSTGSAVITMIRQASIAIGIAIFVAIIGPATSPDKQLAAFRTGWWVMTAVTAVGFVPLALFVRRRRQTALAGDASSG